MRQIEARFDGQVPETLDELVTLHGVGRKTAAVVSSNAFGRRDGIAVDTHVRRVSRRLRLTRQVDPVKVERVLMRLYPRERWLEVSRRADLPRPARLPRTPAALRRVRRAGAVPVRRGAICDRSGTAAALFRDGPRRHHCRHDEDRDRALRRPPVAPRRAAARRPRRARACGWAGCGSRPRRASSWACGDCAVLEALGVLTSSDEAAERRLVDRRLRQLEVVERFQAIVEAELERHGA